jgi:hypothetical protein
VNPAPAIYTIDITLKNRLINGTNHLPCIVSEVLLVASAKIHFEEQVPLASTNQSRHTNKAGRLTRQAGQQGRQANKAGRPARQAGQQGRQASKAGRLARQAGQQGWQASKTGRPTKQAGQQSNQASKEGRPTRELGLPALFCACFSACDSLWIL